MSCSCCAKQFKHFTCVLQACKYLSGYQVAANIAQTDQVRLVCCCVVVFLILFVRDVQVV